MVTRQFLSQSIALVGNTPKSVEFTVPQGYSKLTGVFFDPSVEQYISIYAQKAQTNLLNKFSTKIGTAMGFINPNYNNAENDILQVTLQSAVAGTYTISLSFE